MNAIHRPVVRRAQSPTPPAAHGRGLACAVLAGSLLAAGAIGHVLLAHLAVPAPLGSGALLAQYDSSPPPATSTWPVM